MDQNIIGVTGRLTKDPEQRNTQSGKTVCNFTIAIAGFKKEDVHFIDVEWWPSKPEHISYFHKGDRVSVAGSIAQKRWTDQSGKATSRVVIQAQQVINLMPRPSQGEPQGQTQQFNQGQQFQQPQGNQFSQPQGQQFSQPQGQQFQKPSQKGHFFDEDIPF